MSASFSWRNGDGMNEKKQRKCTACSADAPKAGHVTVKGFLLKHPEWQIQTEDNVEKLRRRYTFASYSEAIDFTDEIAALAEFEDHHPAILLEWGAVTVTWWTHKIGGLHNNDLIMAEETDALFDSRVS